MVLIHHAVIHLDASFLWHSKDAGPWFHGGVSLFFILSGFLIIRSAEKCHREARPWRDFYRNRALRIVPALYAYFAVTVVFLLATGALTFKSLLSLDFAIFAGSNLFLAPVYSPGSLGDFGIGVLNGSLWTIPVEVSFYVVVPLLVILAARVGWNRALVAAGALAAGALAIYGLTGGADASAMAWKLFGVTFLPFLWYFVIGIFWSRYWDKVRQSGWFALVCTAAYFVIINLPQNGGSGIGAIMTGLAALPLSYAAIWFGYNAPRAFRGITDRIGDLSFGTYIWHMIVVNTLVAVGARNWDVPGTVLVTGVLVGSMLIAAASWNFVEKPALGRKNYSSSLVSRNPVSVG
ncbi:acyltransferase [Pseudarthrobacter sp. LMD1-1-1.1]